MTVYVKESSKSILAGLSKMKAAMVRDYKLFMPDKKGMCDAYEDARTVTYGKKYIKLLEVRSFPPCAIGGGSALAFIVGVDTDKKFKMGDILMAASWSAPARNKARGNVLDGDYGIKWTGPTYLTGGS